MIVYTTALLLTVAHARVVIDAMRLFEEIPCIAGFIDE